MTEDRKWLWAGRFIMVLATASVFANDNQIVPGMVYIIGSIMLATSAILRAINSHLTPSNDTQEE